MWKYYALLSAFFAALTAILAKAGIKGISGNLATAIRTVVILFIAWGIVLNKNTDQEQYHLPPAVRHCHRPFLDILLQSA